MRTLHIFGDSFTEPFEEDWVWTKQLATKLKVEALRNHSCIGVSNDWIFSNIRTAILEQRLRKDDIAVVVITSPTFLLFSLNQSIGSFSRARTDNLILSSLTSIIFAFII